jgi:curved DNA-binding protein
MLQRTIDVAAKYYRGRMKFQDYYARLGLARSATADEIKRAYRKLARKYHPDVSKEADAEQQFKEVSEAYKALKDPEKRAAYDAISDGQQPGQEFNPPPGWDSGFEFSGAGADAPTDFSGSDFFEALFGRRAPGANGTRGGGADHHAKVQIDLQDAYRGARRSIALRVPQVGADGRATLQSRQLDVSIPKGVRAGQHLRLAGQGSPAHLGTAAGDLYLEIEFAPHAHFRVDDRDVYLQVPITPWEAALGARIAVPTPDGSVQLTVPVNSGAGRTLRLRGKGLPSDPPGDLYAQLAIVTPPAEGAEAELAYRSLANAFPNFNPRHALET